MTRALESAARTGPPDPECMAKTSKTGLKPQNNPYFRVQEWAGNTFCYLAEGLKWPAVG